MEVTKGKKLVFDASNLHISRAIHANSPRGVDCTVAYVQLHGRVCAIAQSRPCNELPMAFLQLSLNFQAKTTKDNGQFSL